jgi:hypothetical protein
MEWRRPSGCGFATTSAEERVVSGFELTLMNTLWDHQKPSVKEDVDGNVRNGKRSREMLLKIGAREPCVTIA